MPTQNEIAWHERHSEWQGEMNATVRELNKNQDVLEANQTAISLRIDKLSTDNAVAAALAIRAGRRWGVIGGIVASVITALIVHAIVNNVG